MIGEVLRLSHNVRIARSDAEGRFLEEWSARNAIYSLGKNLILSPASDARHVKEFAGLSVLYYDGYTAPLTSFNAPDDALAAATPSNPSAGTLRFTWPDRALIPTSLPPHTPVQSTPLAFGPVQMLRLLYCSPTSPHPSWMLAQVVLDTPITVANDTDHYSFTWDIT